MSALEFYVLLTPNSSENLQILLVHFLRGSLELKSLAFIICLINNLSNLKKLVLV